MQDDRREAVIFDVDGTLVDVRSIRHHVMGVVRNFDAFHSDSIDCPPNEEVVSALHEVRASGRAVVVVTARMERHSFVTTLWLKEAGAEFDDIFFRPNKDQRPDQDVKREILRQIEKKYKIVHAWDDNPSIIELWVSEGIPVTHVPGWE